MNREVDAFVLPGKRKAVRWHVARRSRMIWLIEMEHEGRPAVTSTIAHRPDRGDPALAELERRFFHES